MEALLAGVDGPFYDLADEPQRKVAAWREQRLTEAGVTLLDARILAMRRDLELHDLLRMLGAGCPVHLLKEIVL